MVLLKTSVYSHSKKCFSHSLYQSKCTSINVIETFPYFLPAYNSKISFWNESFSTIIMECIIQHRKQFAFCYFDKQKNRQIKKIKEMHKDLFLLLFGSVHINTARTSHFFLYFKWNKCTTLPSSSYLFPNKTSRRLEHWYKKYKKKI